MSRSRSEIGASRAAARRPNDLMSAGSDAGDPPSRRTGLSIFGDMPWGAHISLFYETTRDLLDSASAYFAAGLASNEFCVWAVSDPIAESDARAALRLAVPDLDDRLASRQIEMVDGVDWYLKGDQFDLQRVMDGWNQKLQDAFARGHEGLRISGNAFWTETDHWGASCEYEQELARSLSGQKMLVLCTYPLQKSRAADILDVTRSHQVSVARRKGAWELVATSDLKLAKREIHRLQGAFDILSKPFPGLELLTPRERLTLAHIVRGSTSKEVARALGLSPRTVEFHRANIMRKLSAKNAIDLVRRVIGDH